MQTDKIYRPYIYSMSDVYIEISDVLLLYFSPQGLGDVDIPAAALHQQRIRVEKL